MLPVQVACVLGSTGMQQSFMTSMSGKPSPAGVQAIYVPADDLTDPAPATTFAHLDATTVLSRAISELGIYPAVDPLDSTSRMLNARIIGQEHYDCARGVQQVLQVSHRPLDALPSAVLPALNTLGCLPPARHGLLVPACMLASAS